MTLTLSRYHVVSPALDEAAADGPTRLLFSTRTGRLWALSEHQWERLRHGQLHLLPSDLVDSFVSAELLVPADADELSDVVARSRRAVADDTTLSIVLQPTALCQLGCSYCGQSHSALWMTPTQQRRFLDRVDHKLSGKPFRHLDVGWFGAEPLSGLSVIRSLSPELARLAASHGCTFGASMVTNGLALMPAVATELVRECSVRRITITLDGVAEYHDARRHHKDGRPTFERIFNNVVALARRTDLDVQINVRSNVDRFNYAGISPLLRLLADHGVQKRIHYYVAPIHAWGNDAHTRSLAAEEFAQLELGWLAEMVSLGFPVAILPELVPIVCLAVRPDAEVVDATGALFNCTEVSYVPAYGVPNRFAIGSLENGESPGRRQAIGSFHDRVLRFEVPCAECRMLPVCGGACPKAWLEGHSPCPSAKTNIETRLLLAYAKESAGMSAPPAVAADCGR
jgi:uncharacterized protein